jgi:hypothetical protein
LGQKAQGVFALYSQKRKIFTMSANNTRKHYDARGHEIPSWEDLKRIVTDKTSLDLLRKNLLCKVVVIPGITVRIMKNDSYSFEVVSHYCGAAKSFRKLELTSRRLSGFRRLWKTSKNRGWTVENTDLYVSFSRGPRVILDSLRRF